MRAFLAGFSVPVLLLSLAFAVKALFLAFYVTPLWDIPDETGHYSYVRDLVEGRGLPLLGEATIDSDIRSQVKGFHPQENWIAQHPPTYYLLAAIPLKIATAFSDDQQWLFRITRLVSAISGALAILVLFRALRLLDVEQQTATALAAVIGFVPMFSQLASGTNHDVTLFLFCSLASLFFVRYLKGRRVQDAYWCALWLAIAGFTKMTAWVFLAPAVAIMIFELQGGWRTRLLHATGIALTALSLPVLWMTRNYLHFGNPLYTSLEDMEFRLSQPLDITLSSYVHSQPVIEHFVKHFYGLIGWMGSGVDQFATRQIVGWPAEIFGGAIVMATGILVLYLSLRALEAVYRPVRADVRGYLPASFMERSAVTTGLRWLTAISLPIALFAGYRLFSHSYFVIEFSGRLNALAAGLLLCASILSIPTIFQKADYRVRVMAYGLIIFMFFALVLLLQAYDLFVLDGEIRAAHGRYFYPVLPMLIFSLGVAVRGVGLSRWSVVVVVAFLALAELDAFLLQVMPFYSGGRI